MDLKKFGDFIKELRKEKGLNQEELAEELLVHRTTVVKWEQGKALPLNDTLIMLSKYFNVTVDELLAGGRKTEETSLDDKNEVTLSLLSSRRRSMLIAKYFAIIAFIIGVLFLIYYFFTTYNSIHVYTLAGSGDSIKTRDGILIISNDSIYLKFGNFYSNEDKLLEVNEIIFYLDDDYHTKVLFSGDPKNLIVEIRKNIEIFGKEHLEKNYDNIYLLVRYNGNEERIKLAVVKDFENKSLLQLIFKNTTQNYIPSKFDIKLSDKFKYDASTDTYKLKDKNVDITCSKENYFCKIIILDNDVELNYEYDGYSSRLAYKKVSKNRYAERTTFLISEISNNFEQKIYDEFKEKIIDKYLS